MRRPPRLLAALLALASAGPARAASTDPSLTWRTLTTPHFRVHFHDGEARIAAEMADAAEAAWTKLVPEIGTEPRGRVELALIDWTDSANGSASIVPRNTINIFVTNPGGDSTLGLYEDWNEAIVTHELTHILHLDTVRGLPRVARAVFGRIVSTHQVAPAWTLEGYATFEETRFTHGGRGRSATADMVKRAAVLEGRFPALGSLEGYQSLPPGGNLRYLFGQDFIQYITDSRGAQKFSEWVQRYGASIPYFLPSRRTFGDSFVTLWREWKGAAIRRYQEQAARIEAEGLTEYTVLSDADDNCGGPAYAPDGTLLVFSCEDPRRGSRILRATPDGADVRVWAKGRFADAIQWRSDSGAFVYSSLHSADLWSSVNDVVLFDVKKKAGRLITDGARAADPAFSPDGSRIVVATNDRQQNQLSVLTVDGRTTALTHFDGHEQIGWPRYAPDGGSIVVSMWRDGMRDLWLLAPDGSTRRRLTADVAIEREPAWSADGRTLYFVSDRTGVPNVYALDVADDHVWRVTNVKTGAFNPAPRPDGKKLAFNVFSTVGTKVAVMDLDRARWKDLGGLQHYVPDLLPPPSPPARVPTAAERVEPAKKQQQGEQAEGVPSPWPVRPYNPLASAFPPTWWMPGALLTTTGESYGLYLSALTSGSDPLHFLGYSAYLTWRTDANFVGGGGSLVWNRWRTVLGASMATYVSPYGDYYLVSPSEAGANVPGVSSSSTRYWDHRIRGMLSAWYPLGVYSGVSLFGKGESRAPLDALPADVYTAALPTRGFFTSVGGGWSYGKGESYALSISPEDARSLGVGVEYTPSWLGSTTYDESGAPVPFDQLQATAEWREYHTNPWVPNHVFATKLSAGATIGDAFRYGSFRLGGYWSENGITVVPDEWRALRGFYPATAAGEWYWLGSEEYRFPLWYPETGFGTLPVYLKNVSGAVFVDAGDAYADLADATLASALVGVGAELRVYAVVGYGYPLYARFGYAFAAHGDGIPFGSLDGAYVSLGSSF